jgi:hypothetical protein
MHTIFYYEELKGREHLEDLNVDMRIISKCIFKTILRGITLDASGSGWDLK